MSRSAISVAILYNIPGSSSGNRMWTESDAGVIAEVKAVENALHTLDIPYRRAGIISLEDIPSSLVGSGEKVIFNLVESLSGTVDDVNAVPAVVRSLGKSCTGCDTACLSLCLDKWQARAGLIAGGLSVPPATVVPPGSIEKDTEMPSPPLIVKPLRADASEGIDDSSIVSDTGKSLQSAIRRIHDTFNQPALVESFISGREINVSILQRGNEIIVLPPAEIDFSAFPDGKPRIVGYSAKWKPGTFEYENTPRKIPARISRETESRIRKYAVMAWHAAGCRDYARVDFRLDENDNPYILEVNPNPDISPDAGFAAALNAEGISYAEFVMTVVNNASSRLALPTPGKKSAEQPAGLYEDIIIRRTISEDRKDILKALTATDFFRQDEVIVATEVLDDSIAKGASGDYQSYTAEYQGMAVGWLCYGRTPCTIGTFDIYWVVVSPECQGRGVGKKLMAHAERLIGENGGRVIVVETAGRPIYEPTRRFYLSIGYKEEARLKDFYSPGDDKVVYIKHL